MSYIFERTLRIWKVDFGKDFVVIDKRGLCFILFYFFKIRVSVHH